MQIERDIIGFGIAGNFAKHLEQAGEMEDFVGIETEEEDAPKGIFPTYIPEDSGFLGIYPFSSDTIRMPEGDDKPIQMEPEVALLCDVKYTQNGQIAALTPTHFAAYNDCSIRIEGAPKISHKKNWGAQSKGVSQRWLPIDRFSKGGIVDRYALTSYLKRDGKIHQYGEDSPLPGYSYFYEKLIAWITDKLNTQRATGPLEALPEVIRAAKFPPKLIISIGATRYTPYGESHYLQEGDKLFVIVYDRRRYTSDEIEAMVEKEHFAEEGISPLIEVVKN